MIFIDGIIISQHQKNVRRLAGARNISFREKGDINRDGSICEEEEVIGEHSSWAWIQGSHATSLRVKSFDGVVALAGNPGRWGKPDNLFNLDLDGTLSAANFILQQQDLPPFSPGVERIQENNGKCETYWTGARVWSIHMTQNYETGSADNAKAVLNWADTQSVARVKKSRLGGSTVVWGSLKYCQIELYIKADEMLAHCKGVEAKEAMKLTSAYLYAVEKGIIRLEVKAAKDYLRDQGLTYLGAWDMGTVHRIFAEKAELLSRVKLEENELNLLDLPSHLRMTAAAWLRGEDVAQLIKSRMTFYRHAKGLRNFGIDIAAKRNVKVFPVSVRVISICPVSEQHYRQFAA